LEVKVSRVNASLVPMGLVLMMEIEDAPLVASATPGLEHFLQQLLVLVLLKPLEHLALDEVVQSVLQPSRVDLPEELGILLRLGEVRDHVGLASLDLLPAEVFSHSG